MHTQNKRTCPQCGGPKPNPKAKVCRTCFLSVREPIDNGDGTHTLPLTRGTFALIDSEDVPLVAGYNWTLSRHPKRPDYAVRGVPGNTTIYLHRLIAGAGDGEFVDHENRNGLDCRRSNIRITTPQGNMANVAMRTTSTSPYKGVRLRSDRKRWTARIQINGRGIHLGSFDTAEEAARAYDAKARELFGEFAGLNFPDA